MLCTTRRVLSAYYSFRRPHTSPIFKSLRIPGFHASLLSRRGLRATLNTEQDNAAAPASESTPEPADSRPNSILFIGNVPWEATIDDFHELFGPFGPIKSVRIGTKGMGRYAFLQFETVGDAVKVMEEYNTYGFVLKRIRSLRMCFSHKEETDFQLPKKKKYKKKKLNTDGLFVSNLPPEMTKADILEFFEPYGRPKSVFLHGESSGRAHVKFHSKDATSKLLSLPPGSLRIINRPVYVEPSDYNLKLGEKRRPKEPKRTLYYSGYYGSYEELNELLKDVEGVKRLSPRTNDAGDPSGIGFVEFETVDQARLALKTMLLMKDHNGHPWFDVDYALREVGSL